MLLGKVKGLFRNEMIYSSFYSGLATLIKVSTAFVLSKVIAIYIGPEGLALMGQLSNFVTVVLVFAGGGFTNGIIKYVAEYRRHAGERLHHLINTCFSISILAGSIVGLLLLLLSAFLPRWVLGTGNYTGVFWIFGVTVVFFSLNSLFLAISNGHKDYKRYNSISITGSIIGLILSCSLIRFWGIYGALAAVVTNQSVIFWVNYFFIRKAAWFEPQFFRFRIHEKEVKALLRYLFMAIVTAVCMPVSQMFVRRYIGSHLSVSYAGIWEAVNRISTMYLMFITISLTTYYLPKISETIDSKALKREVAKVYRFVMPLVITCSLLIYLLRTQIIHILFTKEFVEAEGLFAFQLTGDVLKIASWLMGFILIAKGKVKIFVTGEIIFSTGFAVLTILCFRAGGFQYISLGYAINYLLYGLFVFIAVKKTVFDK